MTTRESRWWVVNEADFLASLRRVDAGESPDAVLIEFVANSESEVVAEGIAPVCGVCGDVVRLICDTCGGGQ